MLKFGGSSCLIWDPKCVFSVADAVMYLPFKAEWDVQVQHSSMMISQSVSQHVVIRHSTMWLVLLLISIHFTLHLIVYHIVNDRNMRWSSECMITTSIGCWWHVLVKCQIQYKVCVARMMKDVCANECSINQSYVYIYICTYVYILCCTLSKYVA